MRLQGLRHDAAAAQPPSGLRPVTAGQGKVLGGLYAARYGDGSTLRYHELIVFVLARRGPRLGAWITGIFVDDDAALAGGHAIWHLGKRPARVDWEQAERHCRIEVSGADGGLCRLSIARPRAAFPLPLWAKVWTVRDGTLTSFHPRGSMALASAGVVIEIPAGSEFASLGFTSGRAWFVERLALRVPPPS